MPKTRDLYVTYSFETTNGGIGQGRNTITLSSAGYVPELLSMAEIRKIEQRFLQDLREKAPDAHSLHLTWWAEIRPEDPSPAPTEEG